MAIGNSFNLKHWIDEHRHLLRPPVGNSQVWKDADFIVMIVGGPNQRKDYHINDGEEFYYQLEGDMVLKVIDEGEPRDIPIREGDVFLLPPRVPHSPQRGANTVGVVVERKRQGQEEDHLRWYCDECGNILYDASFHLTDITTQLKPVIQKFNADMDLRTCKKCSHVLEIPEPPKA